MKVDVRDLLESSGLGEESFYSGKRLVKKFLQPGEYKSHCIVFEWHDKTIHVELKAGVNGRTLDLKELRHYPVSFQARTFLEVETGEEDEGDDSRGKSSGGGQRPAHKKNPETTMTAFSKMADSSVSTFGEIKKFVIMGKEIAKAGYEQAFENLRAQLSQTRVLAMDLMKGVADIIHKATPGGGLAAKGDETIKYNYDAERTGPMFGGLIPT